MKFTTLPAAGRGLLVAPFVALLLVLPAPSSAAAPAPAPVVLVSLDGLSHRAWREDPAMRELKTLLRIAAQGVVADGMVQAFPSVTPAGHAAVWTGAWGDVSGIVTALNPVLPRSEHTFVERNSGFFATNSRAEPIWVSAARQGVRTVAHEATQNYPFVARATGELKTNPPILVSGYGPGALEPYGIIRPGRTEPEDAAIWQPPLPRSELPVKAFRWKVQNIALHGALVAEHGEARGYTAMFIAAEPGAGPKQRIRVPYIATESTPPHQRALARHFGEPLQLHHAGHLATGYFRLFELAPDGSDFLLMQVSMHPLEYYDGTPQGDAVGKEMVKAVGGFIGNGPGFTYQAGNLGKPIFDGGDGTAERRYLEGMELVLRQYNRHTQWVWNKYRPAFLVDYSPYPDEMEHGWYGLAHPEQTGVDAGTAAKFMELRKWGYAAIETRVALFDRIAGPRGSIVFVGDHGMAGVGKDVNFNRALERAGLLTFNPARQVDVARSKAIHNKYGVLVNTTDWLGGIVPLEERKAVIDQIETVLAAIVDPQTGKNVITAFFRPETHPDLGLGGPAGADIYFDLLPGYSTTDRAGGDVISLKHAANGEHGFLPTRDDMLASFIARGPRFVRGKLAPRMRAIDVASIVSEVLGIQPPADNRGVLPEGVLVRGKAAK